MQQPDYSHYDQTALRQALRSIDAARFPERVTQIQARLAELAAVPPAMVVRAHHAARPLEVRRAARALLALAAVDLAADLWNVLQGTHTYMLTGIVELAIGLALMRGSLRLAEVVRWLGWLALAPCVLVLLTVLAQPADLTLTQLRLAPFSYLSGCLLLLFKLLVTVFVTRELGGDAILRARAEDGRRAHNMRVPLALGLLIALVWGTLLLVLLGGERGRHAEQLAAQRLGSQYRYHTNALNFWHTAGGTHVAATVQVWNDRRVGAVAVNWDE